MMWEILFITKEKTKEELEATDLYLVTGGGQEDPRISLLLHLQEHVDQEEWLGTSGTSGTPGTSPSLTVSG